MSDRIIELVNADIDGELSGPERAELSRVLLADPAARALRDDLARTCAALDALEPVELPAGLHESIMGALPPAPIRVEPKIRWAFLRQPGFRYAATFAGGLLVSALALQGGITRQDGLDSRELAGTIASLASDPSRIDVSLPQVRGAITLEGTAASPVVQTHLAATQPVRVIARSAGREVRLDGFVAPQDAPVEMSAGFGADAPIDVEIIDVASGSVLQTARLHTNMPPRR